MKQIKHLIPLTLCLLILAGCSSMKASLDRIIVDPNTVTIEHYEASHETLLVDWERVGFWAWIYGFGQVGSKKTKVESEGAEIVEDTTGIVDPLRKVMP